MHLDNKIRLFIIGLILLSFSGCYFKDPWTEEERKKFETQCLNSATIDYLSIEVTGFDDNEFDTIIVREFTQDILTDSFYVDVRKSYTTSDKDNKIRHGSIDRTIKLNCVYKFFIPGQKPYQLSNIKMEMTNEHTMQGEDHGCRIDQYELDGRLIKERSHLLLQRNQE
jgi:hypothetical protein